jgi:hypothetical protein
MTDLTQQTQHTLDGGKASGRTCNGNNSDSGGRRRDVIWYRTSGSLLAFRLNISPAKKHCNHITPLSRSLLVKAAAAVGRVKPKVITFDPTLVKCQWTNATLRIRRLRDNATSVRDGITRVANTHLGAGCSRLGRYVGGLGGNYESWAIRAHRTLPRRGRTVGSSSWTATLRL